MRRIQILGTWSAKCQRLTAGADAAAKALGLAYENEKATEIDRITAFDVMFTPALVVDGEVGVAGTVRSVDEVKKLMA